MHKNCLVLILFFLLMIIFEKSIDTYSVNTPSDGYSHPSMTFFLAAATDTTTDLMTTPSSISTTPSSINIIPKVNQAPSSNNNTPKINTTPSAIIINSYPPKTIPPFLMRPNSNFLLSKQYPRQNTAPSPKNQTEIKVSPELFINNQNLISSTSFLIWINTSAQKTYVLTKNEGSWVLTKTFTCATGKDSTPTIKGTFKSTSKASFVYDKKYNCYLKYVTQIYNGYLIHSVILDKDGKIIDGTLGRKKSHGCVRLSIDDSKWIYDNIPLKTTIYIT